MGLALSIAYRVIAPNLSAVDLTYCQLREKSERLAAAFHAMGLGVGDRIATLMGKSQDYLVTLVAIWRTGAVHVPPLYRLCRSGEPAIDGYLHLGTLISWHRPGIRATSVAPTAPFIHIYTSGTTGDPKGVLVPRKALASIHAYAEFGLDLMANDIYWCAADPGWAYGLYFGVVASLLTGTRSLLCEGGFNADTTFEILNRYGVTNFAAAPTVYRSLLTSGTGARISASLRRASSAGEPLTKDVNVWAETALGMKVHDHYGQTEAGMLINNHHHPALARPLKDGSMGHCMPGWHAVILGEHQDEPMPPGTLGRVAFEVSESPLAWFSGYHNEAAKTAEKFAGGGRWYLTGDTGYIDEDGYFYFSARDDDVIIMAGYRIGPSEVENVILSHPAVLECAVIAVPDKTRGEILEAFVVLKDGYTGTPELAADIQLWVKTHYAAHAYPRAIHFVDSLPKTPSGKIQRGILRQRWRDEIRAFSLE